MAGSIALMDREYLSEVSGGDVEFEKELVQAFLDSALDLIEVFAVAATANDTVKAVYASHTLKGSSRSIGANQFAMVAEEVEKAARGDDLETCRQLEPNLRSAFEQFAQVGTEFLAAA
jgi:two-component system sensor histidine kinase EvgS